MVYLSKNLYTINDTAKAEDTSVANKLPTSKTAIISL